MDDKVLKYIDSIDFKKKSFGNLEEEDVLNKVKRIRQLHVECVNSMVNSEDYAALQQQLADFQNELATLKQENQDRQNEIETLQAQVLNYQDKINSKDAEIEAMQEVVDQLKELNETQRSENVALVQENKELADVEKREAEQAEINRLKEEYQTKIDGLTDSIKYIQDKREEAIVAAQVEAVEEASAIRGEVMEKLRIDREAAEAELAHVEDDVKELKRQRSQLQQAIKQQTLSIQAIIGEMDSDEGEVEEEEYVEEGYNEEEYVEEEYNEPSEDTFYFADEQY